MEEEEEEELPDTASLSTVRLHLAINGSLFAPAKTTE